ncbi:hypothetical protein [Conexibacter sp. S30A1]|uniref:hypothetical protein n=1 Tax=Conexibacter sp. S30A1 TaxID=2937800 RepID=UPI00200D01BF|nr:hypothetical protein [Conexibacter sp. S30A1]
MLSPDKPPAEHRRPERRITITDRRYHGRDCALSRFLLDRIACAPGSRVALSTFASELHAYVTDDAERLDLPTARQLARQLRARGLSVRQAGPRVWVEGVRIAARDETCHSPEPTSD